ncbi:MAG: hypothetical protein GX803_07105 [Lentisphaerae bacterium]|jgi:hypothetical protein|nr:hypothetical protein [Lentisphaerota bacterium]
MMPRPPPTNASDAPGDPLRAHLETLLNATGAHSPLDPAAAEAVAAAVTTYLEDQDLALPLPDDYLHLLIYRALRTLNQNEAARAWAAARLPEAGPRPVFDPDIWPGPVPLPVWQLFASGLIRPARTLTHEGRILWTLDFCRIRPEQAGWLEITLFPGLRALLEQLAPAWDPSSGDGLLGLRGLDVAGFAAATRRRATGKTAPPPLDPAAIRAYCQRVLANLQTARGWQHRPTVLQLDFLPHT